MTNAHSRNNAEAPIKAQAPIKNQAAQADRAPSTLGASGQFLLRPCEADDLPALERFAAASPVGITTLPNNRAALADRLHRSLHAFATEDASGEEIYLFALEDRYTGSVIGISGIAARAGFADRFYSFRNEYVVHRSVPLAVTTRIHTLHLCHDLTDVSLFISFHIDPAYAHTLAPQLLSRARLLFILQHAERFSERVAAESAGLADDTGRCPFWDAVGSRFFGMDYPTIERLTGGRSKSFIADLMPPSPVYVPLLPDEAQWAIGQLHPVGELPFSILLDEGFDTDTYIDIFDGGPTAQERLAMLKTVTRARLLEANNVGMQSPTTNANAAWQIVANTSRSHFRASLVQAHTSDHRLGLSDDCFHALQLHTVPSQVHVALLDVTSSSSAERDRTADTSSSSAERDRTTNTSASSSERSSTHQTGAN